MIDINARLTELLKLLKTTAGVKIYYQYPDSFATLPAISHYELTEGESFRADNIERAYVSRVQIDIWSLKKTEPAQIGMKVNEIMQADGWVREMSRDLPKQTEDHVYHRTMRFAKEIWEV